LCCQRRFKNHRHVPLALLCSDALGTEWAVVTSGNGIGGGAAVAGALGAELGLLARRRGRDEGATPRGLDPAGGPARGEVGGGREVGPNMQ